jgi:hypothetical protein
LEQKPVVDMNMTRIQKGGPCFRFCENSSVLRPVDLWIWNGCDCSAPVFVVKADLFGPSRYLAADARRNPLSARYLSFLPTISTPLRHGRSRTSRRGAVSLLSCRGVYEPTPVRTRSRTVSSDDSGHEDGNDPIRRSDTKQKRYAQS